MSADQSRRKDKRSITIEGLDSGAVRITVEGSPCLVSIGADSTRNLSTHDIGEVWLSKFAPDKGEDRAAYSAKYCTDTGSLHTRSVECDGLCHDLNCLEPADFLQHWSGVDGKEPCIPLCKWHAHDLNYYVGRAVLWALHYGVVEDLRFWKQQDPLPSGLPRCDCGYYAIDSDGGSERARCTNEATTKVRVTELRPGGEVYEGKLCDACAARESKRPVTPSTGLGYHRHKVEIT
jgi:hypothetical protein